MKHSSLRINLNKYLLYNKKYKESVDIKLSTSTIWLGLKSSDRLKNLPLKGA